MITLTQIKLHDRGTLRRLGVLNEDTVKHKVNYGSGRVDSWGSLYAFNAFLLITKEPITVFTSWKELKAFRGFLSVEMNVEDNEAWHFLRTITVILFRSGDEANKAADQVCDVPVAHCKEAYVALSPCKRTVEEYQSMFECQDPNIGIYVDFENLRAMLGEPDVSYFSELLAKHLKITSHLYAQGLGNCICGIIQGLVYENLGKPLPELRLDKERTKAFVRQVEHQAVDQVLKAGYSIE
ncbi:hypothetical protein PS623_03987 [Pseudomonas fluorescens]|uniref:hypothetical protein n=1 Tax=Pseudomonas fluorescens TaxID=294 RepID=UPI001241BE75|nr:hypothetical protein [Pseudomonas fluorescens]VVN14943.1 hypothetical protein PS623_03987 [Pseudomonas fluorescens]